MTDDVTAISEETSAEAETVAAAAEEQTSSLITVSHTATSLSERAQDLSDALSTFEVTAEPDAELEPANGEGDDAVAADAAESTADGTDEASTDGSQKTSVDWTPVSGRDRHRLPSGEPKVGSEEFAAGLGFDTREVPRAV